MRANGEPVWLVQYDEMPEYGPQEANTHVIFIDDQQLIDVKSAERLEWRFEELDDSLDEDTTDAERAEADEREPLAELLLRVRSEHGSGGEMTPQDEALCKLFRGASEPLTLLELGRAATSAVCYECMIRTHGIQEVVITSKVPCDVLERIYNLMEPESGGDGLLSEVMRIAGEGNHLQSLGTPTAQIDMIRGIWEMRDKMLEWMQTKKDRAELITPRQIQDFFRELNEERQTLRSASSSSCSSSHLQ